MKWELNAPNSGDMIRVKIGSIYHYGIFASENEVFQFGLAPVARRAMRDSEVEVCISNVDEFLCGGFLEVGIIEKKDGKPVRKGKSVVDYARGKLGQKGYNILYNNCEHFCYECIFGKKVCTQADDIRNLFRSMPLVDVYTALIPEKFVMKDVYPSARQKEIESCKNIKVKTEKYFVWKLLEYALNRSFGYKIQNLDFKKDRHGKWTTSSCYFSLSHSDNVVAVAVSRSPVGVDVERIREVKSRAIEKTLTEIEKKAYMDFAQDDKEQFLITIWSAKESVFKASDEKAFKPSKTQGLSETVASEKISFASDDYVLSVCTSHVENIRKFYRIDLGESD